MAEPNTHLSAREHAVVIALVSIVVYVIQFLCRGLDDNRLTSWQWAFAVADGPLLFLCLAGCLAVAAMARNPLTRLRPNNALLFLLSFCAGAVFWGEPEVIVDASRYFTQAKHLELYGIRHFWDAWGHQLGAWTDMPLIPFLYGIIFTIFGEARIWIQVFNSLLFSGSVVLTALIGKELWDEEAGFQAGLLLLGMPYIFTQVPLMLVDVPAMFLLVLSLYLFLRALRGGGLMIAAAAAAITATAYAKYSTWLMLSVLVVTAVVEAAPVWNSAPQRSRLIRNCLGVFLAAGLAAGAVFISKADVFSAQIHFLNAYQRPGLQRWGESFISTFFFQIHPLVTLAALAGLYTAIWRRDLSFLVAVWLVLLVVLLQVRRIRYIVMVFPMLSLMAAYGTYLIRETATRRFFVICVVVSSLLIAAGAFLPFLKGYSVTNLAGAGRYLDALPERAVRVYTPLPADPALNPAVNVPLLDLYTRKRIIYDYDPKAYSRPLDKIATSALRFTWEYRNPPYYAADSVSDRDCAVVVISANRETTLPAAASAALTDYRETRSYSTTEGLFGNQTFVKIYRKNAVFD